MEEIRKFAESTSMKGVPRIMKAKTGQIRVLWIISVLALLCLSVYMCLMLILQYLRYDKAIQIHDLNSFGQDYYKYPELFAVPTVTVCNQNPLTAFNGFHGTKWQEYSSIVNSVLEDADKHTRDRYLSPRAYLEFIGAKAVATTRAEHDFIVDCSLGMSMDHTVYPCHLSLTHFPNVLYPQCFTVNLTGLDNYPYYPTKLFLTLYLDEVSAPMVNYVSETRASSGAVVLFHGPGQLPTFEHAEFAAPGTLTTFKVRKSRFERLKDSKDPCWDSKDAIHIQNLAGTLHSYSQMGCIMDRLQTRYLEKCNCIGSSILVLPKNATADEVRFCGTIDSNETLLEFEANCILSQLLNGTFIDATIQFCVPQCIEPMDAVTATSCPWPAETSQLSFFTEFIQGKSYAEHFEVYEGILHEFLTTFDSKNAIKKLKEQTLIKENFAKIEIVLPAKRADLFTVSYQMSLPSLLAGIGGNLNLWSGISAIIFIELLDLCIKLILSTTMKKQNTTKVTDLHGKTNGNQ